MFFVCLGAITCARASAAVTPFAIPRRPRCRLRRRPTISFPSRRMSFRNESSAPFSDDNLKPALIYSPHYHHVLHPQDRLLGRANCQQNTIPRIQNTTSSPLGPGQEVHSAPSYNLRCLYGHVLPRLDIFLGWHAPQNTIPDIYDTNANFSGLDQKVRSAPDGSFHCPCGHGPCDL